MERDHTRFNEPRTVSPHFLNRQPSKPPPTTTRPAAPHPPRPRATSKAKKSNAVRLGTLYNSKKVQSKMKKLLAMTMLLCISMVAMATAQMKAYSPPEQDIGCIVQDNPLMVATLSVDGQAVATFDIQCNIVDWQTTTETIASAQCVDAYTVQTADGCTVGMALYALRWPKMKNDLAMNLRNDYTANYPPDGSDAYSFTDSRTDHC